MQNAGQGFPGAGAQVENGRRVNGGGGAGDRLLEPVVVRDFAAYPFAVGGRVKWSLLTTPAFPGSATASNRDVRPSCICRNGRADSL